MFTTASIRTTVLFILALVLSKEKEECREHGLEKKEINIVQYFGAFQTIFYKADIFVIKSYECV